MADGTVAVVRDTAAPARSPSRGDRARSREPRGRANKTQKPRNQRDAPRKELPKMISIDSKGIKYCGGFNSQRGCVPDERKCPQRGKHVCNAMIDKGKACGRKDHGAPNH